MKYNDIVKKLADKSKYSSNYSSHKVCYFYGDSIESLRNVIDDYVKENKIESLEITDASTEIVEYNF